MITSAELDSYRRLDAERAAIVEVTSEEKDFPVESAFVASEEAQGWRAAEPGRSLVACPSAFRFLSSEVRSSTPNHFVYEISEGNSAVKAKSLQVTWYFVRAISQLVPEADHQVS
jgi:hypothetical protein